MNPTTNTRPPQRPTEIPIYCDCCSTAPKKMAVLHIDAIEIVARRSGKKHRVRFHLPRDSPAP